MKKMKRIFAALLCLCMMASVLPMGAAATDTAATEVNIDFTSLTLNDKLNTDDYILSDNVVGYIALSQESGGMKIQSWQDHWIAFRLGNLKEGYYDGVLEIYKNASCANYKFYIIPEKATAAEIEQEIAKQEAYLRDIDFNSSTPVAQGILLNAYLPSDGNYMMVGKYSDGYKEGNFCRYYLQNLTMERVGGTADFSDKASIDFTDADVFNAEKESWLASSIQTTFSYGKDTADDGVDKRHTYFQVNQNTTRFAAFDIGTIKAGSYKGKLSYVTVDNATYGGEFDVYLVKVNAVVTGNSVCGGKVVNDIHVTLNNPLTWELNETHYIGKINFLVDDAKYWNTWNFEAENLTDGRYYLVAKATSNGVGKYGYIQGFEMVPADFEYATVDSSAQVTGSDVLGENYAYIRKDGSDWVVNFFGGVKKTEGYSKVGFEVVYNGNVTKTSVSDKVYTDFRVGGQKIAATDFGADVQWIFGGEFALNDIDTTQPIKFRAYAVAVGEDGNETTVYGKTYTATIE